MLENIRTNFLYLVGGMLIASFLILRFVPKPVPAPASQEVEQLKQKIAELTSQKKSVVKEYNCNNGALSKETTIDELIARKFASSSAEKTKKVEPITQPKLELSLGLGAQVNISRFSEFNLDHVKPQLAVGAGYGEYSILAASDLRTNHAGYFMRVFKF